MTHPSWNASISAEPTNESSSFWRKKLVYNAPIFVDWLKQPARVLAIYYCTNWIGPTIIEWMKMENSLKMSTSNNHGQLRQMFCRSLSIIRDRFCPPFLSSYLHPFSWKIQEWHWFSICFAFGSILITFANSWLHFRYSLKIRAQKHTVFDSLMNKEFTAILRQSLTNLSLDTDTHLSIIKYLYPIIKSQYLNPAMSAEYIRYQKQAQIEFDEYVNESNQSARMNINTEDDGRSQQSITTSISAAIDQQLQYQQQQQFLMQSREQISADANGMMLNNANILAVNMNEEMKENLINYTLKIVQFTCANVAWYSSKWENISIKYKHHRMIGVFLCQQPSMSKECSSEKRLKIREIICKCLKRKQYGIPDINRMSEYCKILCLTLQHQNGGHWAVMIGHRTLFRSFYTCNMEYDYDGGYIDMDMINDDNIQQEIQQHPLTINLKTDANFIHLGFGFGMKCFNWSVIVVHLEGK